MAGRGDPSRLHWAISCAVAAFALGFLALLFRAPSAAPTVPAKVLAPAKGVTLVGRNDRVVTDESILLDPTPLFLPTKWNAAQRILPPPEVGARFQGYDTPKLTFAQNELKMGLPSPIKVPASVAEAVQEDVRGSPLVGFGRVDANPAPLKPRGAFVEVLSARTGQKVLTDTVLTPPPGSAVWQPLEYVIRVNAAGLVGRPMVTIRSGVDDVDAFFANYLIRNLRIGERLDPGFYRISIGP